MGIPILTGAVEIHERSLLSSTNSTENFKDASQTMIDIIRFWSARDEHTWASV